MSYQSVIQQSGVESREELLAAARKVVELFRPDTIAEMLDEIQRTQPEVRPSVAKAAASLRIPSASTSGPAAP
ncbi:hypothetical protein JOF53_001465 [Crossiella equi]|uniref:Uncharacterized protein n=1 Tax=Crossiella equi TaxID=130796 RepID=A0ABS5A7M8_9PSEU|nr:hypothetical protein [Crossiella equi]